MTTDIDEIKEITGLVDHIIFRNDENGYTVLVLEDDTVVTGLFPSVSAGENLLLRGDFVVHETYGVQFQARDYEITAPEDEEDIIRYLGSGAIKGIGPALAKRIVKKFGTDTFNIMENEPERLSEIKGISEKKAREIADIVLEKTRDRSAILYLMKFGIKNNLAMKIYKYYGSGIYKIMETNPYRLAEDIRGVGFKMADEIAIRTGIRYDTDHRTKSGIIYILNTASLEGHTYLPVSVLKDHAMNLLGVEESTIEACVMQLSIEKKIVVRGECIYLFYYYKMEQDCASMLLGLNVSFDEDSKLIEKFLDNRGDDTGISLDEKQRIAVHTAATKGVMILTGGPGTGKTTTIKTIIDYFENEQMEIALCAPTGRAAKRMSESTGRDAMTIHRLLEVNGGISDDERSGAIFARGADYPLECDVIIMDEASMVDISLFYFLLKATPMDTRLILVGDADQLPSVGPGNVLKDMIDSDAFTVVRLENIFRQEHESHIVINAHKIQNNQEIIFDNKSEDFFFLNRATPRDIFGTMVTLIKNKLPDYVNAREQEIQVLAPMRKGNLGVINLNSVLQKYLNPPSDDLEEQTFGDRVLRVGDKVMQIKNNYQLPWRIEDDFGHVSEEGQGIFNGDMGIIKSINTYAKIVSVEFDDKKLVDYSYAQTDELEHSFAVTVHKSQGSEYPAVIIPLMNVPTMLMNRNLIYTAITRAKRCVVLLGSQEVFQKMVENDKVLKRYSGLKEAITGQ